ncbi:MAG: hypothetical protein LVQ75_00310 [Candidatus Babeliales bacterium]
MVIKNFWDNNAKDYIFIIFRNSDSAIFLLLLSVTIPLGSGVTPEQEYIIKENKQNFKP